MMKTFTVRDYNTSFSLFDENGKLVGEILYEVILGLNVRIKIGEEIYKIKSPGFFSYGINVLNKDKKLVLKTDFSKDRMFYYGNHTEIYTYKSKGRFIDRSYNAYLYDFYDNPLVVMHVKKTFSKTEYKIEVEKDFNNYLVILSFLHLYLRDTSGA